MDGTRRLVGIYGADRLRCHCLIQVVGKIAG